MLSSVEHAKSITSRPGEMHYSVFKTISPIELASEIRDRSRISGEGVHMYNGLLILSFLLKYPMKMK